MPLFPAYADTTDASQSNLLFVVIGIAILGAVCALAFIPVRMASRRRHRHAEAINVVALLWAVLALASAATTLLAQMKWANERLVRIQSGYYDPGDNTGAPAWPWPAWAALAVAYAVLIAWSAARKDARPREKP